jgi:hypothetical protein
VSAQAASRQAQERKAHKACLSGDYAKGVSILSDLFVDSDDPTYILNQGRCFEQNRRYEDAIARFQEYLRAGMNLKPSDKVLAEKHIADCQNLLTKQPDYTWLDPMTDCSLTECWLTDTVCSAIAWTASAAKAPAREPAWPVLRPRPAQPRMASAARFPQALIPIANARSMPPNAGATEPVTEQAPVDGRFGFFHGLRDFADLDGKRFRAAPGSNPAWPGRPTPLEP